MKMPVNSDFWAQKKEMLYTFPFSLVAEARLERTTFGL